MNHDITTQKETFLNTEAAPGNEEQGTGNLTIAAELATKAGVDLQEFMAAAYGAYLAANPQLRQELESQHLQAQFDELRRRGRLAQA